ncbi:MAG TPA: hypothetical protein VF767_08815 [Bryobacteraceae bacterium]
MISELLIAALIVLLGGYWFRYNCLAILRARIAPELAGQISAANDLSFLEVHGRLEDNPGTAGLDALNRALLRDYQVLTCLLRYTAPAAHTAEHRMLMLDFQFMQLRYFLARRHLRRTAHASLEECARILNHFAGALGARTASSLRA